MTLSQNGVMPLDLQRGERRQGGRSLLPRQRLLDEGEETLRDDELLAAALGTGYRGRHVLEVACLYPERWSVVELLDLRVYHLPCYACVLREDAAAPIDDRLHKVRQLVCVHALRVVPCPP